MCWRCGVDAECGLLAEQSCVYGCGEFSCWEHNEGGSGEAFDLGSGYLLHTPQPPATS